MITVCNVQVRHGKHTMNNLALLIFNVDKVTDVHILLVVMWIGLVLIENIHKYSVWKHKSVYSYWPSNYAPGNIIQLSNLTD